MVRQALRKRRMLSRGFDLVPGIVLVLGWAGLRDDAVGFLGRELANFLNS